MSALLPPSQRIWWKQPLDKVEGTWIALALIWCLILFFMMPFWHVYGKQNLSNEAYRIAPEAFQQKAQALADQYTVRTETDAQIPVVKPPAGSDIYLVARLWQWWPIYELEKGRPTGSTCPRSTGSTGSRSSRSTSTCRCSPATTWW